MSARGENNSNYGKPWSSAEDAEICRLSRAGVGAKIIAHRIGRPLNSIYTRARVLGASVTTIFRDDAERAAEALQTMTWERLASCHGPDRADRIMAGQDPKTNADIQAWRALGRRTGEAA